MKCPALVYILVSTSSKTQERKKKKKSVRWREGSWKKERAIVQSVTDPNGVLPSHPPHRVLGEREEA